MLTESVGVRGRYINPPFMALAIHASSRIFLSAFLSLGILGF